MFAHLIFFVVYYSLFHKAVKVRCSKDLLVLNVQVFNFNCFLQLHVQITNNCKRFQNYGTCKLLTVLDDNISCAQFLYSCTATKIFLNSGKNVLIYVVFCVLSSATCMKFAVDRYMFMCIHVICCKLLA